MSETSATTPRSKRFSFPTAYTILFILIAVAAAGTWIVPAGRYDRVENPELGREVPAPGTWR